MFDVIAAIGSIVLSVCGVIALIVMLKVYFDEDMDEDCCCDCCECCRREDKN